MASILLAFLISMAISLIAMPWFSRKAIRVGLVDNPDRTRKLHLKPIPMVGGLVLFCTVSLVVAIIFAITVFEIPLLQKLDGRLATWLGFPADYLALRRISSFELRQYVGLFTGSLLLLIVGLLDDRFGIRGRQKLFGQFLAATVLILFGFKFESVAFLGINVSLNLFSILFIYGWILATINSVNLLDGADGIASTIGIIMSLAMTVMMLSSGHVVDAVVAVSVAGALIGFLRYNFPPASAYLGDTGSMLIGFLLAALAIRCTVKQSALYAFAAPIALLAIPFIDTSAAIIRRRLTGRSIFAVDRGHLHHKLMKQGFSPRASLIWVALLSTMSAAGGVLALVLRQPEYAFLAIACVITVMVMSQIFGLAETNLIAKKAYGLSRSLVVRPRAGAPQAHVSAIHVQGHLDWNASWERLCAFASEHDIHQLTLDVNAPWLHESYHAKFKGVEKIREADHIWEAILPMVADQRVVGRVVCKCSQSGPLSHREVIDGILDITSSIESLVRDAKLPLDEVEEETEFPDQPQATLEGIQVSEKS